VAEKDPAEALKLSLALLRFVTPTLQAAAIADVTPPKHPREQLAKLSDEDLIQVIVQSSEAAALVRQESKQRTSCCGVCRQKRPSRLPRPTRRKMSCCASPSAIDSRRSFRAL
jgi:hypothetical protein